MTQPTVSKHCSKSHLPKHWRVDTRISNIYMFNVYMFNASLYCEMRQNTLSVAATKYGCKVCCTKLATVFLNTLEIHQYHTVNTYPTEIRASFISFTCIARIGDLSWNMISKFHIMLRSTDARTKTLTSKSQCTSSRIRFNIPPNT